MFAKLTEAFQAAPPPAPPPAAPPAPPPADAEPQKCPTTSVTSFPVKLGLAITDTHYESVEEPIAIDFQWSERTTAPSFLSPGTQDAAVDEVGGANMTRMTLRFMEAAYTIMRVELAAATHTDWILPASNRASNKEDLIITFETTNDLVQYKYLIFVVPLLRSAIAIDPSYLRGLADPTAQGPFKLRHCFPSDSASRFAMYSTCLDGYGGSAKVQNVNVFVSIAGIPITTQLATELLGRYSSSATAFPLVSPPFLTRFQNGTRTLIRQGIRGPTQTVGKQTIGDNSAPFTSYVITSRHILDFANMGKTFRDTKTVVRETPIDAYKCVPFDPDKQVSADGKIRVDLDSGAILTDVLAEREQIRKENNVQGKMEPGRLEKYLSSGLGIVMAILASVGILYFIGSWVRERFFPPNPYVALAPGILPGPPTPPSSGGMSMLLVVGISLLFGFLGFLIGTALA